MIIFNINRKGNIGFTSFVFLMFILLLSGCSKKNNNPVNASSSQNLSFTLNGGGFNNQKYSFDTKNVGAAFFDATNNNTSVIVSGSSGGTSISVLLSFTGNSTGTFNWDTTYNYSNVMSLTIGDTAVYIGLPGEGSTKVTQYGNVGSAIAGTFSGKLANFSGYSVDTVTISSGSFSVKRVSNQQAP